jgi:hypothetical protein
MEIFLQLIIKFYDQILKYNDLTIKNIWKVADYSIFEEVISEKNCENG